LQALTDDEGENNGKNSETSRQRNQKRAANTFASPHGVIVLNDPGYLSEGFSPIAKASSLGARGPVFGKIKANDTNGDDSNNNNGTSHAGV
jgi:hypothetical protein